MYREYVAYLNKEPRQPTTSLNDDLVIMEMKWIGVYHWFMKKVEAIQNNKVEFTPEQISDSIDYYNALQSPPSDIKEKLEEFKDPNAMQAHMVCHVESYSRFWAFTYFWGHRDPKENGFASLSMPDDLLHLIDHFPLFKGKHQEVIVPPKPKLPVYSSLEAAAKMIGGHNINPYVATSDLEATAIHSVDDVVKIIKERKEGRAK